jgi:hypothetical protein
MPQAVQFNIPSRRDLFKHQIKDKDGFVSYLRHDLFKRQIEDKDGFASYLR